MTASTIDPRWRDDFVMAMRMRDVTPDQIADQLKLVETHCVESGEPVSEAFGDPRDYAEEISPAPAPESPWELVDYIPVVVGGLIAGRLLVDGVWGVVQGRPVEVTVGSLAASGLLVLSTIAIIVVFVRLRRPLVPTLVLAAAAVVLAVLLDIGLKAHVTDLPAWLALVISLGAILAFGVWAWIHARRERITDPVTGESML